MRKTKGDFHELEKDESANSLHKEIEACITVTHLYCLNIFQKLIWVCEESRFLDKSIL